MIFLAMTFVSNWVAGESWKLAIFRKLLWLREESTYFIKIRGSFFCHSFFAGIHRWWCRIQNQLALEDFLVYCHVVEIFWKLVNLKREGKKLNFRLWKLVAFTPPHSGLFRLFPEHEIFFVVALIIGIFFFQKRTAPQPFILEQNVSLKTPNEIESTAKWVFKTSNLDNQKGRYDIWACSPCLRFLMRRKVAK